MDGNKLEVNGNLYGVGVAQDGSVVNQNIIVPEHTTPKQLTSKLGKDTIIGRVKELEEIDTLLKESSSLLLINGIGGIGKSTIASYYLHSQKENLDYYGFFEGLESFIFELREPLALQEKKEDDAFMEALAQLRKLEGDKLLVFDDVKDIEENQDKIEKILALKNSGYKILLTSREEIEDVEQYYLDVLSLVDAKELFNSIYKVENEVLLEEILEYLDCHAFFVEMTAKTLKSKKTLTPEIIKEKFKNGEFSTIKRKRKESFNDYLNELFSFDELDDEEVLMLKQLSVLPSIEIEFNILKIIFKKDEELEDLLNDLSDKGWLNHSNANYKLHQIIKEYIFLEHCPLFKDIEFIVVLLNNIHVEATGKNQEILFFYESMVTALEKIKDKNLQLEVNLFYKLGEIYQFLSYYKNAEFYYQKIIDILKDDSSIIKVSTKLAMVYERMGLYDKLEELYLNLLKISEKENVKKDIEIAKLYDGVGNFYKLNGNYIEAEKFLTKSLNLKKSLLDENDDNLADSYSYLASLYMLTKKYDKAEPLLIQDLNIIKKRFGKEDSSTGISYNNLGLYYFEVKKYEKAEIYYLEALKIYQIVFEKKHSLFATLYNNFGLLYMETKNYEKAEKFFLKSLSLREELLGKEHLYTAQSYNHLSKLYMETENYGKAFAYVNKALEIRSKVLSSNHVDLIDSKNMLVIVTKLVNGNIPKKIQRNSPCFCGSGKKYKKCCGKNDKFLKKGIYIL